MDAGTGVHQDGESGFIVLGNKSSGLKFKVSYQVLIVSYLNM